MRSLVKNQNEFPLWANEICKEILWLSQKLTFKPKSLNEAKDEFDHWKLNVQSSSTIYPKPSWITGQLDYKEAMAFNALVLYEILRITSLNDPDLAKDLILKLLPLCFFSGVELEHVVLPTVIFLCEG